MVQLNNKTHHPLRKTCSLVSSLVTGDQLSNKRKALSSESTTIKTIKKKTKLQPTVSKVILPILDSSTKVQLDKKSELFDFSKKIKSSQRAVQFYFSNNDRKKRDESALELSNMLLHPQRSSNKLDLHYLFLKEAATVLDKFLDMQISNLIAAGKPSKHLLIITGNGNHSPNGISVIKEHTIKRLEERKLVFVLENKGCLGVSVKKDSLILN